MAIFGFHVILTLLSATIFGKIQGQLSLCDLFVFKGLYYYLLEGSLFPRLVKNKQLQQQKTNAGNKRRRGSTSQKDKSSTAKIEEEQKDRLIRLPLNLNALEGVPFFDSLIWTFNYSCFALFVFVLSDLYNLFFPENKDLNASMIWTFCALILQINILLNIAFEKVSIAELFPERNTLICATGLFFLGSLLFNAFSDQFLDIEFTEGYINFIDSLNDFIKDHGFLPLFSSSARSPLLFLVCLALIFSTILSAFFFPLLQFTSLYFDSFEEERESNNIFVRFILHTSFMAPVVVFLLFLRPIVEQILEFQIITHNQLKSLRLFTLLIALLARIYSSHICLQTFLDRPKKVLIEYSFKNLKDEEKQRKIANYASYACTAALQLYMPIAIILSIGMIFKNLADISFCSPLSQYFWNETISTSSSTTTTLLDKKYILLNILFSKELHEPLWTLALTNLICGQCIICLFGVIMRKTMGR
ncbi:hypothetical protein ACQ4LE_007120 [Meloidogyne hapla]|uniref:G_PROTEIN_RECEP_F1_2 domain-containing protein n=1 Tax=Meloidogyne hapla TaxID=6305 RepID=A0A1I8BLL2_MELHA